VEETEAADTHASRLIPVPDSRHETKKGYFLVNWESKKARGIKELVKKITQASKHISS